METDTVVDAGVEYLCPRPLYEDFTNSPAHAAELFPWSAIYEAPESSGGLFNHALPSEVDLPHTGVSDAWSEIWSWFDAGPGEPSKALKLSQRFVVEDIARDAVLLRKAAETPPTPSVQATHIPSSSIPSFPSTSSYSPMTPTVQTARSSRSKHKLRARVAKYTGIQRPPTPRPQLLESGSGWVIQCSLCDFVQRNNRVSDMRRHFDAHFPDPLGEARFPCIGVPVDYIDEDTFQALPEHLRKIREYRGEVYVGGCGRQYGRKSSFQRHLNKHSCFASAEASYLLGNIHRHT